MIKRFGNIYASIFLIVLSVVMYVGTYSFGRLTVSQVGSEFVPRLAAIGIFLLSIVLLIQGIKIYKQTKVQHSKTKQGKSFSFNNSYSVVATIGLLIVYVALLREIGFLVMTVLYLIAQFYVLAEKSKRNFLVFSSLSVVVSFSIYYLFRYVFFLMLPAGILG